MNIINWNEGLFPSEGIYRGMPANVYHALGWPMFAHSSSLSALQYNEIDYVFQATKKEKPSSDMIQGSGIHGAILERKKLSEVIGCHRLNWSTLEGKREKAELFERFGEDNILTAAEFIEADTATRAVLEHREADRYLYHCKERELSAFANLGGATFAVRLDAVGPGLFLDLKTTRRHGASLSGFRKVLSDRFYHVQAALYRRVMNSLGADLKTCVFIAVEKEAPFQVACYELNEEAFEKGDAYLDAVIPIVAELQAGREPRGYTEATLKIGVEAWI